MFILGFTMGGNPYTQTLGWGGGGGTQTIFFSFFKILGIFRTRGRAILVHRQPLCSDKQLKQATTKKKGGGEWKKVWGSSFGTPKSWETIDTCIMSPTPPSKSWRDASPRDFRQTYQVECFRCQRDREPVQDAGELLLWRVEQNPHRLRVIVQGLEHLPDLDIILYDVDMKMNTDLEIENSHEVFS